MRKNNKGQVASAFAVGSILTKSSLISATTLTSPIIPDTSVVYSSCPPCEASWQSIEGSGKPASAEAATAVVEQYLKAVGSGDYEAATATFCPQALCWQGQSEALRNNTRDIQNYQQFYAEWLDGNAPALNCVQSIEVSAGLVRVAGLLDYADKSSCERASWTIDVAQGCIAGAYGSSVPDDPKDLRDIDSGNKMPWQNATAVIMDAPDATLILSAKGSCVACDTWGEESLTDAQIKRATAKAFAAWVGALLDNNSTAIADEYCENATLWGTVSAARRNTYDEIKSYFDWFANSRNFTESIESTCAKVTKLGPGMFFVSESLRLDGQCLKMQFTVSERGDGAQCVTSLDSSYTPETPELLAQLDEQSPGPGPAPAPPSSSMRLVNAVLALALAAAPAWLA